MELHLRIEVMTAQEAEIFINENTPFQVDDINEEFDTVIFDVRDQEDADSLEMALQDIFWDEMINGTFEIEASDTNNSFEDPDDVLARKAAQGARTVQAHFEKKGIELPDPSTLGADGLAMIYGYV